MARPTSTTTAMNQLLPQLSFHHRTNEFCLAGWAPGPEGASGSVPFPALSPSSLYQDAIWL